uniref:YcgI protein n=1 Tax=Bacillus subtilis TaxID=1423 RepID=P94384_BACIU|nr:ycgI [Bacillus subtilis]
MSKGSRSLILCAYHAKDSYEHLDQGATIDAIHSIHVKVSDHLYSNPVLSRWLPLIEDTGPASMICCWPACRPDIEQALIWEAKRMSFRIRAMTICAVRLSSLAYRSPTCITHLRYCMDTVLDEEGNLSVETPLSDAGDYVRLRAEMDLIVAFSSCPRCNRDIQWRQCDIHTG